MKFHRVDKNNPCQICGGLGCTFYITKSSRVYLCLRNKDTNRFAIDGRGIHYISNNGEVPANDDRPVIAGIGRRHAVYSAMIDKLYLSDMDKHRLMYRGLLSSEARKLNYVSVKDVASDMNNFGYILDRVPGFYFDQQWKMNAPEGFFIPVLDFHGKIQGLQIRTHDEKRKYRWFSSRKLPQGASSGAPTHFRKGVGSTLWITESPLKADVGWLKTGFNWLGRAGVSTAHKEIALKAFNFDKIIIADDLDWKTNPEVKRSLNSLARRIIEYSKVPVYIATWPDEYKGVDDFLLQDKNCIFEVNKYDEK